MIVPIAKDSLSYAVFLLFMFQAHFGLTQSVFTTEVSKINRGYLLTQSRDNRPNQPLAIVLHSNGSFALASFRNEAFWKKLKKPATIIFPMAINNQWNCDEGINQNNEVLFIKKIIEEAYSNYQIDRNRVFVIAEGECFCVAEAFSRRYPKMVTALVRGKEFIPTDLSIINQSDSLANIKIDSALHYELWKKPEDHLRDLKKEREDSIKRNRWDKRTTLEFGSGGFAMMGSVKTDIDDKTYMDISDAHQQLELTVTKWMSDSMSWFINATWLRVPQKQEVKFTYQGSRILLKGEGGGGAIVPVTVGFKYAFNRNSFRPYFLLGTGATAVVVLGGKFKTTSLSIDPSAIQDDVESEIRTVFHLMLGSGCEWRLNKRIILAGHVRYLHSSQFESAGQINAVKGFSTSIGLGWIFGANKLH